MSEELYDSLVEKWCDFLEDSTHFAPYAPKMSEDDVDDFYDELVRDFCKQHGYSEKTKNFAFYTRWYDTFADDFYKKLEDAGVKIIHDESEERKKK